MMSRDYGNQEHGGDSQSALELFKQVIRAIGGSVGVIAIVTGLVYVTQVIKLLMDLLTSQEGGKPLVELVDLLGGAELTISTMHGPVPLATPLAVVFFLAGLLILGWLSLGLIITGAKVVSYCLTDRKSIKELLTYTFGPKEKPDDQAGNRKKIESSAIS
jgi:hypothetical protein